MVKHRIVHNSYKRIDQLNLPNVVCETDQTSLEESKCSPLVGVLIIEVIHVSTYRLQFTVNLIH